MNLLIYFLILISKILEIGLGTLRLIIVSKGKKTLGAILQLVIAIIWVLVTGSVIVDIKSDPLKLIFFGLGSFIGSYVGSFLEEKIAFGDNVLIVISEYDKGRKVTQKLREFGYAVTILNGEGMKSDKLILMIVISRRQRPDLIKKIKKLDNECLMVSENALVIDK